MQVVPVVAATEKEKVQIAVPAGCTGGETIEIEVKGTKVQIKVPEGVSPGQTIEIEVDIPVDNLDGPKPAETADMSIEGDEAKEIELAEKQIQARIGMHPKTALCRMFMLNLWAAMCYGTFLLITVQFWTKYGFDGDYVNATRYLAYKGTLQGVLRAYAIPIFGHICDRTSRKGWLSLSQFTAGAGTIIWGIFANIGETPVTTAGWLLVPFVSIFDAAFKPAEDGFNKDVSPEHCYNKAKIPMTDKHFVYTRLGQDIILQITGSIGFLLGNIIAIILLVVTSNETVIMIVAGVLYVINAFMIGALLPEPIDPEYVKNNSVKSYFQSGEFKEDLHIFKNFDILTKGSRVLKAVMLYWFLEQLYSANASVVVNYITYRFGMGATELIIIFFCGALAAIPSVLCAPNCNKCLGEAKTTTMRNSISWVHNIYILFSGFGRIYWYPFAFLVGVMYFGQVTLYSWPSRLADYHQQSELTGTIIGMQQMCTALLRVPYAELMVVGFKNTELKDYGGRRNVKDCSDEKRIKHWCEYTSNATAPDTDTFPQYGKDWYGKDRTISQQQAYVRINDGEERNIAVKIKCNANDYKSFSRDYQGELKLLTDAGYKESDRNLLQCYCEWKETRCPEPPAFAEEVGGAFDPLVTPFYLSAAACLCSMFWFVFLLFRFKPIAAMQSREKKEIAIWRQATFKKGDLAQELQDKKDAVA